jgi:hypothetical protein
MSSAAVSGVLTRELSAVEIFLATCGLGEPGLIPEKARMRFQPWRSFATASDARLTQHGSGGNYHSISQLISASPSTVALPSPWRDDMHFCGMLSQEVKCL